jgi:hypothetical protein
MSLAAASLRSVTTLDLPGWHQQAEAIGPLMVRMRAELGISQYGLAERLVEVSGNTSVTRDQVNRWERHKRIPTPYWRRHLAAVFGLPIQEVDKAAALARKLRTAADADRAAEPSPIDHQASRTLARLGTLEENLELWDELMRRRDFLASAGVAALVGTLPPDVVAGQIQPDPEVGLSGGSQADLMTAYRQLHAAHAEVENLHGPASVYRPAHLHHQQLLYWHQRVTSESERRESAALVSITGGFIGWLNFDLAHFGEAVQWFRHAAELAAQAGDVSLCANNLGQASRALAATGEHGDAVAAIDIALSTAGTAAHPGVRSWLHAVRSEHHARRGETSAASADLHEAAKLFERIEDGSLPVYIGYLDAAELDKWTGHTLVRLGSTTTPTLLKPGSAAIDRARKAWNPGHVRGFAEVLTTASRAALADNEKEEAALLMHRAREIAQQTGSARNLRSLLEVDPGGVSSRPSTRTQ